MESGFSSPLPMRVAALVRRKKRKRLGFLCLGVGYLGLVFGSSIIFCPDLSPVSSMISVLGPASSMTIRTHCWWQRSLRRCLTFLTSVRRFLTFLASVCPMGMLRTILLKLPQRLHRLPSLLGKVHRPGSLGG